MLKIFFLFRSQILKTEMEYTVNFWMMILSGIVMRSLLMAVVFVLFYNIPDIAGWQAGEVYLILGFIIITEGLCNLLFDGLWYIPSMVFRGEFDVILSRPIAPLYQVLVKELGIHGIGNSIIGLISIGVGLLSMGWFTPLGIVLSLFFVVTGTIIRMSYNLIALSHVFWIHGGVSNLGFLVYSIGELARYPIMIYPGWLRFILFFIIPAGFIGFVPTLILRGDEVLLYGIGLVAVMVLYFLLARAIFYRGIKRYESIGM